MQANDFLCKKTYLSRYLNLTRQRLEQLVKEGILSAPDKKGEFEFLKAVKEYIIFLQKMPRKTSARTVDIQVAKARRENANADMAEIEADKMKKKVIFYGDIQKEMEKVFLNFKARLLSVPNTIASQGLGISDYKELRELVEKRVYEALDEMSEYDPGTKKS